MTQPDTAAGQAKEPIVQKEVLDAPVTQDGHAGGGLSRGCGLPASKSEW